MADDPTPPNLKTAPSTQEYPISTPRFTPHARFFRQSSGVIIAVGSIAYEFPRWLFEKYFTHRSDHVPWIDEATSSAAGSQDMEKTTLDNPIVLEGVSNFEVEALLGLVTARFVEGPPKLFREQWIAALELAIKWNVNNARDAAIREIDKIYPPLEPIDRYEIALRCGIRQWLLPAYIAMCKRPNTLTLGEAKRLGISKYQVLVQIREEVCKGTVATTSGDIKAEILKHASELELDEPASSSHTPTAPSTTAPRAVAKRKGPPAHPVPSTSTRKKPKVKPRTSEPQEPRLDKKVFGASGSSLSSDSEDGDDC